MCYDGVHDSEPPGRQSTKHTLIQNACGNDYAIPLSIRETNCNLHTGNGLYGVEGTGCSPRARAARTHRLKFAKADTYEYMLRGWPSLSAGRSDALAQQARRSLCGCTRNSLFVFFRMCEKKPCFRTVLFAPTRVRKRGICVVLAKVGRALHHAAATVRGSPAGARRREVRRR